MYRILILSSAAIAFSGCSLIDSGSYYGQGQSSHAQSSAYGYNNCEASNCASGNSYSVADNYAHEEGYGAYQEQAYTVPQQPAAHAYGSQVQHGHAEQGHGGHNYGGQGYGQIPQLRGAYGSRGYKYGTLGIINYDKSSEIYGLQGRLGYQATKYFGAEVEGSFGVLSDKATLGATELKAGVDYSLGAFTRGVVPLGQRFNVFGRAGYHATKVNASLTDATGTISDSDTPDGFAYGVGAEFVINPRDAIRLDYTRYDLGPDETDSLAVAYARRF